jgi:GNAT superfamily N-acetyltransferase
MELLKELAKSLGYQFEFDRQRMERQFSSMEKDSEGYASFVYEEEGKLLGFISVVFYETMFHYKGTALITELVVKEESRGRRIGKALLERVIEEAEKRRMDEVEVGVKKENKDAIRFYKRNGMNEEYILLGKSSSNQPYRNDTCTAPEDRIMRTWQEDSPNTPRIVFNTSKDICRTKAWIVTAKPPPWTRKPPLPSRSFALSARARGMPAPLGCVYCSSSGGASTSFLRIPYQGEKAAEISSQKRCDLAFHPLIVVEKMNGAEHRPVSCSLPHHLMFFMRLSLSFRAALFLQAPEQPSAYSLQPMHTRR